MLDTSSQHPTASDRSADQGNPFAVAVFQGADTVRKALTVLSDEADALTLFQTSNWLANTYEHLAPFYLGTPYLVIVRGAHDGVLVLALPLVVVKERGLRVAGFPDFGLSDYGAPLVSRCRARNFTDEETRTLWKAVCAAATDIDRLSLTNMPLSGGDRKNLLAGLPCARPSAHARYVVALEDTVEVFLRSRGKKYRKEVERCFRLLSNHGAWSLHRAQTRTEIGAAFDALESLQSERWQGQESGYGLESDAVAQFYTAALQAGDDTQGAQIFTLQCGDEIIAVLYGVRFQETFTLLRIASASGAWRRISPGRLIVIEAMRHFVEVGIRRFDLGIGDYAFKRGLGAKADALVDIEHALSWSAKPHVMLMQAKGWLRRHPRLLQMAKAARQKMPR